MTHIDLFSGIGGFALAARWAGFETVAFVEIEPYAQELIKQNFGAVSITDAERCHGRQNDEREIETERTRIAPRLFGDIFAFDGTRYRGATLLTGGFPCQPFSQAGKRRGAEDDRYLWPEMLRVIHEARPAWVLGENVAGIVTMELDRVLSDLEGEGYAVQPIIIPACAVDAKHRRDRVWIVGHAADPRRDDTRQHDGGSSSLPARFSECRWPDEEEWFAKSGMGRVANGIPARVDRLKGLGNAIVPQVAFEIVKGIAEIEK